LQQEDRRIDEMMLTNERLALEKEARKKKEIK
jgi:hypothetical protein